MDDDRNWPDEDWDESDRPFLVVLLLCILLGVLGVHRFFVGKIGTVLLLLFTGGGFGVWWLVDLVLIATGNFREREGLYIRP